MDVVPPKFAWGQRVVSRDDLFDDGSFPGAEPDGLIVPAGAEGEIVQTGIHEESGTHVYMVEFLGKLVVGCREEEIAHPGDSP